MTTPNLLPDLPSTLHLLRLDPIHCPTPDFSSLPIPYTYTELPSPLPPPSTLLSYLQAAHVLITTRFFLPSSLLSQLPNLRHVAVLAIGTDHVDVEYCRERGISVSNVPAASNEAVSEHGLTFGGNRWGGELGNRVANLCRALGMTVQMGERKGVPSTETRPNYTPFSTVIATSTVLFLTLPLTPTTTNLITSVELSTMRKDALIVNIARGGI
ncbi:hypothetical protein EYC84_009243 [Monilinia fructicola]|uniref:D-isomer specific 2-hydroxyacid dehydrogenase catalytic domain-containing protein n=1 Tax=Monilinia fructicola TaxID=38448 RepID=A0A5M9JBS1_MONFR|nr:hypothetical protein EYC84_009243 [Monilinia fructicola]